jgi:dihydrofolate reductase
MLVHRLIRIFRYAWASPCSLVGLLLAALALLLGGRAQVHGGVLEIALPGTERMRQHLGAITFGHVVLGGSDSTLAHLRAHEFEHVKQYERWGLFFFLAYPASSLIQLLRGRPPYWSNHFEVQARARSEPHMAAAHAGRPLHSRTRTRAASLNASMPTSTLILIAAVARNGAIGKDNALLWRLPEDLKFFKRTTLGCPVIMGRKTFESIGRPLPGRRNIIVTRNTTWQHEGVDVAHTLDEARALVSDQARVFVIGGGELYAQALPQADELILTEVDADFDADTFFPAWDRAAFTEVSRETHTAEAGWPYHSVVYQRRK